MSGDGAAQGPGPHDPPARPGPSPGGCRTSSLLGLRLDDRRGSTASTSGTRARGHRGDPPIHDHPLRFHLSRSSSANWSTPATSESRGRRIRPLSLLGARRGPSARRHGAAIRDERDRRRGRRVRSACPRPPRQLATVGDGDGCPLLVGRADRAHRLPSTTRLPGARDGHGTPPEGRSKHSRPGPWSGSERGARHRHPQVATPLHRSDGPTAGGPWTLRRRGDVPPVQGACGRTVGVASQSCVAHRCLSTRPGGGVRVLTPGGPTGCAHLQWPHRDHLLGTQSAWSATANPHRGSATVHNGAFADWSHQPSWRPREPVR